MFETCFIFKVQRFNHTAYSVLLLLFLKHDYTKDSFTEKYLFFSIGLTVTDETPVAVPTESQRINILLKKVKNVRAFQKMKK